MFKSNGIKLADLETGTPIDKHAFKVNGESKVDVITQVVEEIQQEMNEVNQVCESMITSDEEKIFLKLFKINDGEVLFVDI